MPTTGRGLLARTWARGRRYPRTSAYPAGSGCLIAIEFGWAVLEGVRDNPEERRERLRDDARADGQAQPGYVTWKGAVDVPQT